MRAIYYILVVTPSRFSAVASGQKFFDLIYFYFFGLRLFEEDMPYIQFQGWPCIIRHFSSGN